jgi:diadenosine tetraphosphatase ApaH/serine/threonine PP2A family protein phosphatase
MRYLILSDIHANLEALDAVLAFTKGQKFDRLLVLGDIVGYGADPNAVVDRVRALQPDAIIRGNHDKVASGVESAEGFNTAARFAAMWTLDELTAENREYLTALPLGPLVIDETVEICHGSPDDEDEYIFEHVDAIEALRGTSCQVCFFGHTHVGIVYWLSAASFDLMVASETETHIRIEVDKRYLINPGSVGQPRDGDPRASFAVFDTDAQEVVLYRVPYDVEAAQEKITRAGLPEGLAKRLAVGK